MVTTAEDSTTVVLWVGSTTDGLVRDQGQRQGASVCLPATRAGGLEDRRSALPVGELRTGIRLTPGGFTAASNSTNQAQHGNEIHIISPEAPSRPTTDQVAFTTTGVRNPRVGVPSQS